jgi:ArsR family transcriptional regulator, arsenate/arsenite/antimonite-responsive transcriptional repressor
VSSHLRVLRTAGLLSERKAGRHRLYSLHPDSSLRDVIAFLEGLLNNSLDELSVTARSARAQRRQGSRAM